MLGLFFNNLDKTYIIFTLVILKHKMEQGLNLALQWHYIMDYLGHAR